MTIGERVECSFVLAAMIPARYAGTGVGEGLPTDRAIPAAA